MSDQIDRVAEAMRLRAIERGHPIHPVMVRHLAVAAIEAMREPTDAMCEAGYSAGTGDWGGRYDNRRELARGRIAPGWQAMIDAALSRS